MTALASRVLVALLASVLLAPARTADAPVPAPTPAPIVVPAAVLGAPDPAPAASPAPPVLVGRASWYCLPGRSVCHRAYPASGLYVAACGLFRDAVPHWRGRWVRITAATTGRTVRARVVDYCASRRPGRLLDLYASVVTALGLRLSSGVYRITVALEEP